LTIRVFDSVIRSNVNVQAPDGRNFKILGLTAMMVLKLRVPKLAGIQMQVSENPAEEKMRVLVTMGAGPRCALHNPHKRPSRQVSQGA
jgi:hypothetical protein